MASPPGPGRAGLPALAWVAVIGGALLLVVMVTLLAIQLAVLKDSQQHIESQDAKITALTEQTRPALDAAEPAIRDLRPLIRQARRALRQIDGGAVALAVEEVAPLLRTARALAAAGVPLLRELEAAHIGAFVANADALLARIADTQLIERASHGASLAPRAVRLLKRTLRVQKTTLTVQRQTLDAQLTGLGIQRRTMRAAESLDRKSGGTFPPTVAAP